MTALSLMFALLAAGLTGGLLLAAQTARRLTGEIEQARIDGAAQQVQMTREVHHRVKNNLQIIASLLSIHSRAADTPPSRRAFATIQRRVDALTIVHRNMASSTELQAGLALRTLMSELASVFDGGIGETRRAPIRLSAIAAQVSEDAALPIAFVATEIIDMIVNFDPGAAINFVANADTDGRARLTIESAALAESELAELLSAGREGRILAGLARQLGTTITHDRAAGSASFTVPLLAGD